MPFVPKLVGYSICRAFAVQRKGIFLPGVNIERFRCLRQILRYQAVTQPELTGDDPDFEIKIDIDRKRVRLRLADNGIGMNSDELVENLVQ